MKRFNVIAGLIMPLLFSVAQATTLKLPAELDLLMLDGHKISGFLLKGADGLELEHGEHQLLFRVEKTFITPEHNPVHWISGKQIVTFTAQSKVVQIQLPPLNSPAALHAFDTTPQFSLRNELGHEIVIKRDSLISPIHSDIEQAMVNYNLTGKHASVPRFARPDKCVSTHSDKNWDIASDKSTSAENVLHLWYQQVDAATRQRFITLMKVLHTS